MIKGYKRIKILSEAEIEDLYALPKFTLSERKLFFSLDKKESAHLKLSNDKTLTVKRGVLALFLMSESIKKSLAESPPPTLLQFAKMTGVPYEELKKVMDDLGLERYCCRAQMLGHIDLIDTAAKFKRF